MRARCQVCGGVVVGVLRAKPVIECVQESAGAGAVTRRAAHRAERRMALDGGGGRRLGAVGGVVVASGADVSIAPLACGDQAEWEGSFRRRISKESRQAA